MDILKIINPPNKDIIIKYNLINMGWENEVEKSKKDKVITINAKLNIHIYMYSYTYTIYINYIF